MTYLEMVVNNCNDVSVKSKLVCIQVFVLFLTSTVESSANRQLHTATFRFKCATVNSLFITVVNTKLYSTTTTGSRLALFSL